MSQLPTNNDIPSNSKTVKESTTTNKPDIVPFEGEVGGVKRSKSKFGAWLRKMFLSDRKPSEIMMDVIENNIVPGIKDNFRNGLVSSLDMFIYQNTKPGSSNASNNSISYNNIFRTQSTVTQRAQQQNYNNQPQQNASSDMSNGFANPCFKYRRRTMVGGREELGAEDFLQMMKEYDYPTLSVHTMYMMRKQRIDYTWDSYGWTREEILSWDPNKIIVHISGNRDFSWMIDLPQAHIIS